MSGAKDSERRSPQPDRRVPTRLAPPNVRSQCVQFANRLSRAEGRDGAMTLLLHVAVVQAILAGVSCDSFRSISEQLWEMSEVDLGVAEQDVLMMSPGGEA